MASTNAIGMQVHESMTTARAVVDAHGTPERKQRLATFYPDVPMPNRDALRFGAYQSELLAGLAEIVRGIKAP